MSSLEATLQNRLEGYDVLVLPGWKNSGPAHWQSHWEDKFPEWERVQQVSWDRPQRSDWILSLESAVARARRPVVLIAHSLGCVTVAHWALRHARDRVAAALLVAPADVERSTVSTALRGFGPIPTRTLPFPTLVVGSDNDPSCTAWRASELAEKWGADFHLLHGAGHINADSRLGDWEEGLQLLNGWLQKHIASPVADTEARHRFLWVA